MKEIRDIKIDLLMGNQNPIVDLFNDINAGKVKTLWIMATNPAVSMPDADDLVESWVPHCAIEAAVAEIAPAGMGIMLLATTCAGTTSTFTFW